jgi:hypothetical protein
MRFPKGGNAGRPACRLMALFGPEWPARPCPFIGSKRTSRSNALTSENDPSASRPVLLFRQKAVTTPFKILV